MNFELDDQQQALVATFERFFRDEKNATGASQARDSFNRRMWADFAELGGLSIRAERMCGGLGLGLIDASAALEVSGRHATSAPFCEAIIAIRLLGQFYNEELRDRFNAFLGGEKVITLALRDFAKYPEQLVAGGAVADAILTFKDNALVLVDACDIAVKNVSAANAKLKVDGTGIVIAKGDDARDAFHAAIEEWKLLTASALVGLSHEALELAAAYCRERVQFGRPIGSYQAIAHPLADLITEIHAARFLVWRAIKQIADRAGDAGACISMAYWWACAVSSRATSKSLHSFGGYGVTQEYDIHKYYLRAKSAPLVLGDPQDVLIETGVRLWSDVRTKLPDAGPISVDFDFENDARALAAETREFFAHHMTPELRRKAHHSFDGHVPEIHRAMANAGLLYPTWPAEYGGRSASAYATIATDAVWDEFGWTRHPRSVSRMVGNIIMKYGADRLRERVLSRIARGEAICCLGFSEPGSGSDVFAAKTSAVQDGEDWVINGQKMFTSGANIADYVLLLARTNKDAAKHAGLTVFVVPLDRPGIEIQPINTIQDERTNITFYSDVRIPDWCRLGDIDGGARVMSYSLKIEQEGGAGFTRNHRRLIESALAWARQQQYDGPPIDRPEIMARLAKAATHNAAADLIMRRAIWTNANNKPDFAFGPMSKLFSSEKFLEDASDLIDLAAPESIGADEFEFIELAYRLAAASTIYGGTSEIHRSQVAERLLRLPRSRS